MAEVSSNVGRSVDDSVLRGSLGNRRASDNLLNNAYTDAKRGLSSFPPNVGLLVRAARQGVRGYEADRQSRQQANWAMQALQTESSTNSSGQVSHSFSTDQIRQLANHQSPLIQFAKSKLNQFGVRVDEENGKFVSPIGELPISMSKDQLKDKLSSFTDKEIQTGINYVAHNVLGLPEFVKTPETVASLIRGQIINALDSAEGSVQAAVNEGISQADKEFAQLANSSKTPVTEEPTEKEPTVLAGQKNAVDGRSGAPFELDRSAEERSPSSEELQELQAIAIARVEARDRSEEHRERIGKLSDNIFEMLSFRYKLLNADRQFLP